MKIELNDKEFHQLLHLLDISDTVLSSFEDTKSEKKKTPYQKLIQKLFALAHTSGCTDLFQKHENTGEIMTTTKFEETSPSQDFIEDFEDGSFWSMLEAELARRDLEEKHDPKEFEANPYEALDKMMDYQDKYQKEFIKNGIKNLRLAKM